jgi:cytochrome c oxidase cbb3-type subunit I
LSAVGLFVMASDLILLGVFQGFWWGSLQPWENSINGSQPFWILRVFAGLSMFTGLILFLINIFKTWQLSKRSAGKLRNAVA